MATKADPQSPDLVEQFTRINQMQADANRKIQEARLAPWSLALTGLGAGAAILAAGATLAKFFW